MRLFDVNVLVYAFREDAPNHVHYRSWLERVVQSDEPYAVSDHVLAGFLRIATHPRVFQPPAPWELAIEFAESVRGQPGAVSVMPGEQHWKIFTRLCAESGAAGNLVPDAWLAALAIEHGCQFITTDRDYGRFRELRWQHPLDC